MNIRFSYHIPSEGPEAPLHLMATAAAPAKNQKLKFGTRSSSFFPSSPNDAKRRNSKLYR